MLLFYMRTQILEDRLEGTIDVFDLGTVVLYTPPSRFSSTFCGPSAQGLSSSFPSLPDLSDFRATYLEQRPLFNTPMAPPIPVIDFSALQEACTPPSPYGLQGEEKFQFGYDLPNSRLQLHFHGQDETRLTHGHLKEYGNPDPLCNLSGREAALLDLDAQRMGFHKFRR